MPLGDQIDVLGRRAQSELAKLRAYYEHTKSVWRLAQQIIDEGRKVEFRSPATGQILESPEIHGLAQTYVTGYLAESVFDKTISLFEDFVFGLLSAWLTAQPRGLPHKERKLTYEVVLEAADKQAILQHIIEKEIDSLKYQHISEWFAYLNERVNLGLPGKDQIAALAELKATRDILVHNAGIVNETYIRKAGAVPRYKIGDQVEIKEPYLYESWDLIETLIIDLTAAALAKA